MKRKNKLQQIKSFVRKITSFLCSYFLLFGQIQMVRAEGVLDLRVPQQAVQGFLDQVSGTLSQNTNLPGMQTQNDQLCQQQVAQFGSIDKKIIPDAKVDSAGKITGGTGCGVLPAQLTLPDEKVKCPTGQDLDTEVNNPALAKYGPMNVMNRYMVQAGCLVEQVSKPNIQFLELLKSPEQKTDPRLGAACLNAKRSELSEYFNKLLTTIENQYKELSKKNEKFKEIAQKYNQQLDSLSFMLDGKHGDKVPEKIKEAFRKALPDCQNVALDSGWEEKGIRSGLKEMNRDISINGKKTRFNQLGKNWKNLESGLKRQQKNVTIGIKNIFRSRGQGEEAIAEILKLNGSAHPEILGGQQTAVNYSTPLSKFIADLKLKQERFKQVQSKLTNVNLTRGSYPEMKAKFGSDGKQMLYDIQKQSMQQCFTKYGPRPDIIAKGAQEHDGQRDTATVRAFINHANRIINSPHAYISDKGQGIQKLIDKYGKNKAVKIEYIDEETGENRTASIGEIFSRPIATCKAVWEKGQNYSPDGSVGMSKEQAKELVQGAVQYMKAINPKNLESNLEKEFTAHFENCGGNIQNAASMTCGEEQFDASQPSFCFANAKTCSKEIKACTDNMAKVHTKLTNDRIKTRDRFNTAIEKHASLFKAQLLEVSGTQEKIFVAMSKAFPGEVKFKRNSEIDKIEGLMPKKSDKGNFEALIRGNGSPDMFKTAMESMLAISKSIEKQTEEMLKLYDKKANDETKKIDEYLAKFKALQDQCQNTRKEIIAKVNQMNQEQQAQVMEQNKKVDKACAEITKKMIMPDCEELQTLYEYTTAAAAALGKAAVSDVYDYLAACNSHNQRQKALDELPEENEGGNQAYDLACGNGESAQDILSVPQSNLLSFVPADDQKVAEEFLDEVANSSNPKNIDMPQAIQSMPPGIKSRFKKFVSLAAQLKDFNSFKSALPDKKSKQEYMQDLYKDQGILIGNQDITFTPNSNEDLSVLYGRIKATAAKNPGLAYSINYTETDNPFAEGDTEAKVAKESRELASTKSEKPKNLCEAINREIEVAARQLCDTASQSCIDNKKKELKAQASDETPTLKSINGKLASFGSNPSSSSPMPRSTSETALSRCNAENETNRSEDRIENLIESLSNGAARGMAGSIE